MSREHYVCMGECKGMAVEPGVCQAHVCSKKGEPLTPCTCEDGVHAEAQAKEAEKTGQ
jgi:hypothetical protein